MGFNTYYSYTFDLQWADLLGNTKFTTDKTKVLIKLQKCPIQQIVNNFLTVQQCELRKAVVIWKKFCMLFQTPPVIPN